MHQLIILGNGFDLACGLESKFSQFFGKRTDGQYSVDSIPEDQRNVWDVILGDVSKEDPLWCDIEGLIAAWVLGGHGKASMVQQLYRLGAVAFNPWDDASIKSAFRPKRKVYEFASAHLGDSDVSQEKLVGYLLGQLKEYETSFACYLSNQVTSPSGEYEEEAHRYFAAIRDACINEQDCDTTSCSILNFNYTVPFGADNSSLGIDAVRNMHGMLGSPDTIFGIDGMNVGEDSVALPFTKTYRLLSLETGQRRELVRKGEGRTRYIKVFGHSLSSADYSYFQAIFDSIDLYGGDVVLVFLYKLYANEPNGVANEDAIREDLYKRVSHLLIEYGATLDNKDHGKNLMHKLLLEQRLMIKRIDKPSVMPKNIYRTM